MHRHVVVSDSASLSLRQTKYNGYSDGNEFSQSVYVRGRLDTAARKKLLVRSP